MKKINVITHSQSVRISEISFFRVFKLGEEVMKICCFLLANRQVQTGHIS